PYPYSELAVAESHLGLGMESPQLIWIPQSSYGRGNLAYLVIHEMAHQWFYGVVGSDGAAEPFADEGLAEFLTRDMLASVRSSQCPGTLDRTVYEYSAGCYYETVYVEGARYLDRYRRRVGDTAFWRGMAAYYEQNRFGIGNIRAFLDSLDAASGSDPTRHITRFPRTYSAE
ncbi:MAG TPA: hypothetical protein VNW68_03705, partial [Candidatus Limnocylindria bacterium]|nr:hypothetical protein [Candidatus Limnocylindria bacterium]